MQKITKPRSMSGFPTDCVLNQVEYFWNATFMISEESAPPIK
jgi:hypothetical protein